ncbi:conserved hypothetical protein [Thiomonas arsenitoxydans]|uniref:Uncharacterized protein n=1 Tax=Thiomonas arsenitoxydans (strain DSM 22701 / CIP 110005 / 3As) TaxID=426114 RepID=D6CQ80_THIA3|nr:hypothetical protein [Thiomonas arsenitoxydans]CAZ88160.1 hypothetical protein THI_1479 [Thiomonas arsenitoxydans]CQR32542.1 conserved hypothetical protein [Thiomonas arsenitoxydans]CQR32893.1 conserved hypothetical protein [Thiomonas arsenitoxydans]CQR34112.1 conserved hypothetical protein [Thiomonas arsenitoxydans]CQR40400.1 conserved hypothetical protein [Thiomonas arsenitoxydans]
MNELAHCPEILPPELAELIDCFGRAWANSPSRPCPSAKAIAHWSELLTAWVAADDLPLFVRKHANNRGSVISHPSGRSLVPCDNSPAHWAYVMATNGECPSPQDIKALLEKDAIPVAMIQNAAERTVAKYHCRLARRFNVNKYGWKLAHIQGVGLNNRNPISALPLQRLTDQFLSLMAPANMFVVPLAWGGIGEIEAVIQAVKSVQFTDDRLIHQVIGATR